MMLRIETGRQSTPELQLTTLESLPAMLRIETEDKHRARLVYSHLDAAGFRVTPPLPTTGLGSWSVVVEGADRQTVFRALPPWMRRGLAWSELEGRES